MFICGLVGKKEKKSKPCLQLCVATVDQQAQLLFLSDSCGLTVTYCFRLQSACHRYDLCGGREREVELKNKKDVVEILLDIFTFLMKMSQAQPCRNKHVCFLVNHSTRKGKLVDSTQHHMLGYVKMVIEFLFYFEIYNLQTKKSNNIVTLRHTEDEK